MNFLHTVVCPSNLLDGKQECGHCDPDPSLNGILPLATQTTLLHNKERGEKMKVPSVGVHFSSVWNKVEDRVKDYTSIPKAIDRFMYCWSRVAEFIWFLRLLRVSNTLSCVWLISEAAKFSANASLPLVRPIRIDFEEDAWGHNAKGNEEPKAYTTALLTDSAEPSQISHFLPHGVYVKWRVDIIPQNKRGTVVLGWWYTAYDIHGQATKKDGGVGEDFAVKWITKR